MTTLIVNLSENSLNDLKSLANQMNITPEDLAQAVIENAIQQPSAEFEQLLERLLKKNAELYRRLAAL